MNISTRQLQAFQHAARLQSFTKAAEQIHISQAGFSMMMRELETQVGTQLFERTTRSVALTDAGRRLLPVAMRVLEDLHSALANVEDQRSRAMGTLRIAATPLLSASLMPGVFKAFAGEHPDVVVQLADADITEVGRRVLAGEADVGLGFFFKPAVGMLRTPLHRFRLMRVSPAAATQAGLAGRVAWSSLKHEKLLSLPQANPIQSLIEKHLAPLGRAHEKRPELNLFGTIIAMVEAGLGNAVIPSFALAECLRHQVRVEVLTRPSVDIHLYMASRRGAAAKPAALQLAAALQRAIASQVPPL